MQRNLFITALLLLSGALQAQEKENQFTIDAQLRTRGEYNAGAITPRADGEKGAFFINERARVSLGYQRKDLELKVSAQHTGVWGQDDIKDRAGRVAMNEAWGKYRFCNGFFAQVGRQVLSYDDERILGGLDWNVAGNSHDAVRLGYEQGAHKVHLIGSFNQTAENKRDRYYAGPMPYKTMQTAWYHYQAPEAPVGISLLAMNLGRETGTEGDGDTRYMQTWGTHFTAKPNQWDLSLSFYYQTGKANAVQKISALMASLKGAYSFSPLVKLGAGLDYLSGNDFKSVATDKVKAFSPLYGTHHKFYGSMDYFYASPFVGGLNPGLYDAQVMLEVKPTKKVTMGANYHFFATASDILVTDSRVLGHEVDLQLTARLTKDVTVQGGYSFMAGTETMDAVKGGDHGRLQNWAWISLNINPRILLTRW